MTNSIYVFENGAKYGAGEATKAGRDKAARNTARIIGTRIDERATEELAKSNNRRKGLRSC